jgi:hypothetical protein
MSCTRKIDAFAHQGAEIYFHAVASGALVSGFAGLQNLFHGAQQTIRVQQHELVKFAPLRLLYLTLLQGFQVKANGSNWGLQFVRDRVDEAVVLLAAANFADQKNRIQSNSGDDSAEENYSQEDFHAFPPVDDNPAAAHRESQGSKADP